MIQLAKLVQKAELSGKELIVNTYCTHLAEMQSDEMITDAEKFLLKCISKHDADTCCYIHFDCSKVLGTFLVLNNF